MTEPLDLQPSDYAYLAAAIQCLTATLAGDAAAIVRAANYGAAIEDSEKGAARIANLKARVLAENDRIWK